jgi:5-hydroxyisourate hydrolase
MGRLTTHVLDLSSGRPAAGVHVTLDRLGPDGERSRLAAAETNEDGRTAEPLVDGPGLEAGTYELVFAVGDYFGRGFLADVPVRFRVDEPDAAYHVPLLASPWSYSTYRGS